MKANAVPLVALFEKKMRLEVPLFQRQYVWSREQQWEPLWEDISRKFSEFLEGRTDAPVHFLGAIVLDQKQTPATHVERRMVIDGQQRLTTLQIFLASFRDFCRSSGASALASECDNFTLNKGMMPDPEVDKFKVWPTKLDRNSFVTAVTAGSPENLENAFPLVWRKWARKPDPRPRIVDAYLFFYAQLEEFFADHAENSTEGHSIEQILEECFQALRNALLVVVIDLEQGDDAQVIFETLNARGEPLLPADLLRNYIFLRAARNDESQEHLYNRYWEPFDDEFWRTVVSQGRINRPRSDLLMQHYLSGQQAIDIPIKHLYAEYRHWIEKSKPFSNVEEELSSLEESRNNFKSLLEAEPNMGYSSLAKFLQDFDIGTVYPFLIRLLSSKCSNHDMADICNIIESYLARRAICGLTNKNYNRVFLGLIKATQRDSFNPGVVTYYLDELRGDSAAWPDDSAFLKSWLEDDMYHRLNSTRISNILSQIGIYYMSSKTERVIFESQLTVEHIMPQQWIEHWPLPNGESGLTYMELWDADEAAPRVQGTRYRESLIHTLGNLTLVTGSLNSAASNAKWLDKRDAIAAHSLLPLNLPLGQLDTWDERSITERGRDMFSHALKRWPRTVA